MCSPWGTVAEYTYNAWGEILSAEGTLAELNPIRYRGYYYDAETGLYYLQSRYYDPAIGRFINADGYASTGQGVLGCNMFAYCGNEPVGCEDKGGDNLTISILRTDSGNTPFINGQGRELYTDIQYGISTVGVSGCEAIALYNALLLSGEYIPFSNFVLFMEKRFRNGGGYKKGGLFGASARDISAALSHYTGSYWRVTYNDAASIDEFCVMIIGFWTKFEKINIGQNSLQLYQLHTIAVRYDGSTYCAYNYYSDSTEAEKFTSFDEMIQERYAYGFLL